MSTPPAETCDACGSALPPDSRFCPNCGAAVRTPGDTAVQELPPTEPASVPVEPFVAERRLFGVPPTGVLFVICIVASAVAITLVALGHVVWGLVLVGVALLALIGFVSESRRLPGEQSRLAQASFGALRVGRERAAALTDAVSARGRASVDLVKLRREHSGLLSTRERLLRDLGAASYDGNRSATKELKEKLRGVDEELSAKEDEMHRVTAEANERIGRARLQVQPTRVLPPDEEAREPE